MSNIVEINKDNTNIPRMKTIRETAELVGLSDYCIRKLCWDKKIAYVMSGTKYLINVDKLIDYLNKGVN